MNKAFKMCGKILLTIRRFVIKDFWVVLLLENVNDSFFYIEIIKNYSLKSNIRVFTLEKPNKAIMCFVDIIISNTVAIWPFQLINKIKHTDPFFRSRMQEILANLLFKQKTTLKTNNYTLQKAKQAVVCGNGPSLNDFDFDTIKHNEDTCLIVSNAFVKNRINGLRKFKSIEICISDQVYYASTSNFARLFVLDVYDFMSEFKNSRLWVPNNTPPQIEEFLLHKKISSDRILRYTESEEESVFSFKQMGVYPKGNNTFETIMLPLAVTVSNVLYFVGLDGRIKDSELRKGQFWEYSKFNYESLFETVRFSDIGYLKYQTQIAKSTILVNEHRHLLKKYIEEVSSKGEYSIKTLTISHNPVIQKYFTFDTDV